MDPHDVDAPPVLLVHTRYTRSGGEEGAYEADVALLEERGHRVVRFERSNDVMSPMPRGRAAATTVWNGTARRELQAVVQAIRPAVVHFHNTFPFLSPSVYGAARAFGAATVQTLHNYRLVCPAGTLLRDGRPCEVCLGRAPLPAVAHGCYRDSRAASAAVAAMLVGHRIRGTWAREVDAFIALSGFSRDLFVRGGLPAERLHLRPNFLLESPPAGGHAGRFVLFAGRLAEEKGLRHLMDAWERMPDPPPLRIAGEGPLAEEVARWCEAAPAVRQWEGRVPQADLQTMMRDAALLVFPSIWYEGCPLVLVEALAAGLPVAAFDLGNGGAIIRDTGAGALCPVDARSLAGLVTELMDDHARRHRLGNAGRNAFDAEYSGAPAYRRLMEVYQAALHHRGVGSPATLGGRA